VKIARYLAGISVFIIVALIWVPLSAIIWFPCMVIWFGAEITGDRVGADKWSDRFGYVALWGFEQTLGRMYD